MMTSSTITQPGTTNNGGAKRHHKLIGTTYKSNSNSDYTEKIEELWKTFKYGGNSHHYWSEPHQSLLFGSPIYEQVYPSRNAYNFI